MVYILSDVFTLFQMCTVIASVFVLLLRFCHLPKNKEEPHFMNQNILVSHGELADSCHIGFNITSHY